MRTSSEQNIVPTDKPPDTLSTDNDSIETLTKLTSKISLIDSSPESDPIKNDFITIDISHLSNKHSQNYNNYFSHIPLKLISESKRNKILIDITINSNNYTCLFDTGAEISVLGKGSEKLWNEFQKESESRKINLRTAGGEMHTGQGVKAIPIEYDGELKTVEFVYAPSINIPITLGMNFYNLWKIRLVRQKSNFTFQKCHNEIEIETEEEQKNEQEIEHTISQEQQAIFKSAMSNFNFSDGDKIGCQKILMHRIDTGEQNPIFSFPYRYNPKVTSRIKEIIDRWLKLDIIERCQSEWRLPIVAVTKPNGSLRLCLDARRLNAITKKDSHVPPNVLQKMDSLPQNAKFFVRLDLNEAFLQTELHPDDRKKTAFAIPGIGEYQFKRMPFGLVNSPATQSRLMEKIFEKSTTQYVIHYLDDVIIMGTTFQHLIDNIKHVSNLLNNHNLTVSKNKTSNILKKIRILGHTVDDKGIMTDPSKIQTIKNWQVPKTGKELERFLGLTNWYRRFIKDYALITGPLYEISKKRNLNDLWNETRMNAFEKLKQVLTTAPVLQTPNWNRQMIIQADACDKGIGAVLCQKDENDQEYVIEYYSYKLNIHEQRYAPTELEMLAVIKAIRHFRYYIEFNDLIIYSDHHALQYLLNMKVMTGRMSRWLLELQPYVNKIKHRAGKLMVVADAISRATISFNNITVNDTWFEDFLKELIENPDNYSQYYTENDKIYRKIAWNRNKNGDDYRELPHPNQILNLIKNSHENTIHGGIKTTLHDIKQYFWWPDMANDVKSYIKQCTKCSAIKFPNYNLTPPMGNFRVPKDTMESLSIDIKGTLPTSGRHKYRNVITVIDLLSRYAWAEKVSNVTSEKIIKFLKHIFNEQQKVPKHIFHDNGTVFLADKFQNFLKSNNIISKPTAIYHPQANPVERFNRSLSEAFRFHIADNPNKQTGWSGALKSILWKLNARECSVTGFVPYEVQFGRLPDPINHTIPENNTKHEEIKSIAFKRSILRYLQNKSQFDKRSLLRTFKDDEIVMMKTFHLSSAERNQSGKLYPPWEVAKIVKKLENHAYEILKLDGKRIKLNAKHIKGISIDLQNKLTYLFESSENSDEEEIKTVKIFRDL